MGSKAGSGSGPGPLGPVFRIIPGVQSYDWGILGKDGSSVAKYAFEGTGAELLDVQYDESKPYAELWMGTHSSLPSYCQAPGSSSKQALSDYLIENPSLLSQSVIDHYKIPLEKGSNAKSVLPFLFKILSVGKALSIQAHPDRELAQKLHKEKPDMYKDANHKPELAVAITDFRGFCGFRPLEEVAGFLQIVPEFKAIVQPSVETLRRLESKEDLREEDKTKLLREIFAGLMKASEADIKKYTAELVERHEKRPQEASKEEQAAEIPMLVRTLQSQFPNDIGIFCSYLLNHLRLKPGQALFLGANEPHAYLEGEIVECMAASDNVVRAGLTPKARDVDVLVSMLTYDNGPGERQYMSPSTWDGSKGGLTKLYQPPIDEFNVLRTALEKSGTKEEHRGIRGPSILIVTNGQCELSWGQETLSLEEGNVIFIGADTAISLTSRAAGTTIFSAFVEA